MASLNYLLTSHVWRQDRGTEPDVVIGCAGDVPTTEALAAAQILRGAFPDLRIRVVKVVDLMRLQDERTHPHALSAAEFDALFTTDEPVIFNVHGYLSLVHRLTYRRANHANFHVHGFQGEGTTTTPFDMGVLKRDRPVPPRHRRHRPRSPAAPGVSG